MALPFSRITIESCVFEDSGLDGFRATRVDFAGCSFIRTALNRRYRSAIEKCSFDDCVFDDCEISDTSIWDSSFRNVRWRSDASYLRIETSKLEHVKFEGKITDSHLLNNEYLDVDCSTARFEQLALLGELDGVKFTARPECFLITPGDFARAADSLRNEISEKSLERLNTWRDSSTALCIDRSWFSLMEEHDREVVLRTLYEFSGGSRKAVTTD